jgi:hypothetical protein
VNVELSVQHEEAIQGLYDLRSRLASMSRDERLIIEMAIMMFEYLDEYAADVPFRDGLALSPAEREALFARVAAARRPSGISWTVDDFDRLICSGGFELNDGSLVPRF